jgi:hypothetical protein
MSTLIWSVESVIIGLWALVLTSFDPNPFHTFMARCHVLIAGFTLAFQLLVSARLLPVGHSISEAFVCAVFGLFTMYLIVLLDSKNYEDPRLFSLPVLERFLPLDGCIGIGWFGASIISALGMALSETGRPSKLMFHHFGYHMLVVPPSFLVFWLYNYDATATEPVSETIQMFSQGAAVSHFVYAIVLVCIWGVFIVLQATGECIYFSAEWPAMEAITMRYVISTAFKTAGRAACILIPLSALFSVRTNSQLILISILICIGIANSFDWLQIIDWLLGKTYPPTLEMESKYNSIQDPAALSLHFKEV